MRDFQNFEKIYSFLKPVFNNFITRNLIAGWSEQVIKEGNSNLHQIYRLKGVSKFLSVVFFPE